jgi:hypothetical protein
MNGRQMRTVIVGILLFLVPAIVCLASLLIKGASMEKATGVAVFRSFGVPFVVAGVLFVVAGLALLRLPR